MWKANSTSQITSVAQLTIFDSTSSTRTLRQQQHRNRSFQNDLIQPVLFRMTHCNPFFSEHRSAFSRIHGLACISGNFFIRKLFIRSLRRCNQPQNVFYFCKKFELLLWIDQRGLFPMKWAVFSGFFFSEAFIPGTFKLNPPSLAIPRTTLSNTQAKKVFHWKIHGMAM